MIDFPGVRQPGRYECGAACFVGILRYYGQRLSLKDGIARLNTNPLDGTDPRTLEAALRSFGLYVLSGEMDVVDLAYHTRRERPVLCMTDDHYVVALGTWGERIYFHDPLVGLCSLPRESFLAQWHDTSRLGVECRGFGLAVWRRQ